MEYSITGPAGELRKGDRTDGVVSLSGPDGRLTAAIRHFWQNYEKSIELDGAALRLWLWPTEGQWPRLRPEQADPLLLPLVRSGLYSLPGSVHKGSEMILDFSGRQPGESSAELSEPLFAFASPAYYAATEAATGLYGQFGVLILKSCFAKQGGWGAKASSTAHKAGAVWLGNMFEVLGICPGCVDAAKAAK